MVRSSPFELALQAGMSAVKAIHGVAVTYASGATTIDIDRAVQGETRKDIIERGGEEQIVEVCDWLIDVADLGKLPETPQPGDLITRVIGDDTYIWTVEMRDLGESAWDWSDTSRTRYRIRSRKDGPSAFEVSKPTGFDLEGNEIR